MGCACSDRSRAALMMPFGPVGHRRRRQGDSGSTPGYLLSTSIKFRHQSSHKSSHPLHPEPSLLSHHHQALLSFWHSFSLSLSLLHTHTTYIYLYISAENLLAIWTLRFQVDHDQLPGFVRFLPPALIVL